MAIVYLGLGSNIGEREKFLVLAKQEIKELPFSEFLEASSVIETEPVEYLNQANFLNQIVKIETSLTPLILLKKCQKIENNLGRIRTIDKGPRTIDIDILLYGNVIMATPKLTIPHKGILNRWFILKHLIELDPNLKDPKSKVFYKEYYKKNEKD